MWWRKFKWFMSSWKGSAVLAAVAATVSLVAFFLNWTTVTPIWGFLSGVSATDAVNKFNATS